MQKFNTIIVEDEPLAAEVLVDYVRQTPFLELKAVCADALYAMDFLQKEKVDLIFLDIHLPKLKGLDFIRSLQHPPAIIITTAYQDYALQGYELNVTDYLLKPIEFSRFLMAVNKLKQDSSGSPIKQLMPERPHLFFNVGKKKVKILLDDILYIESMKEYIKIITKQKSILTKYPLHQIEDILSKHNMLRIHRSFIVSKDKVEAFTATDVEIQGKQIPIGRNFKEAVLAELER